MMVFQFRPKFLSYSVVREIEYFLLTDATTADPILGCQWCCTDAVAATATNTAINHGSLERGAVVTQIRMNSPEPLPTAPTSNLPLKSASNLRYFFPFGQNDDAGTSTL
jgi:hypothetical protein